MMGGYTRRMVRAFMDIRIRRSCHGAVTSCTIRIVRRRAWWMRDPRPGPRQSRRMRLFCSAGRICLNGGKANGKGRDRGGGGKPHEQAAIWRYAIAYRMDDAGELGRPLV